MLDTIIHMMALDEIQELEVMELANEYPLLVDDQETDLIASIEANGIREPLILFKDPMADDYLLDGRNRLASAIKVGLDEIPVRYFVGTVEEAEDLIIDLNEKRRHLLPVQRAYIADKHRAIVAKRAKERMLATQKNDSAEEVRAAMHEPCIADAPQETGTTRAILAKKHNAGQNAIDTVQRIRRVAEERMEDPDQEGEIMTPRAQRASQVLHKMKDGKITVTDAVKSVFGDPGQEIALGEEARFTKAASQFNDGYNKVIENGVFLLQEGRPNDQENVRLKYSHICERFNSLEEVQLQTQHYFPTEREPSDVASRWAGEVRIRLAGVDRMIIEKDVIPSMITENVEFLGVIDRLREFLDNVEKSLDVES